MKTLNIHQAAEFLGAHKETVRRLATNKQIPGVWWLDIRHQGKRVRKCTGTEIREDALIHADESKSKRPIPVPLNKQAISILKAQWGRNSTYVFKLYKPRNWITSSHSEADYGYDYRVHLRFCA